MIKHHLSVPGNTLPEKYRDGHKFELYQHPWFADGSCLASYVVRTQTSSSRGNELGDKLEQTPDIPGLELLFIGVSRDFEGLLQKFVIDVATKGQPRQPNYTTTEQLLDAFIKFLRNR